MKTVKKSALTLARETLYRDIRTVLESARSLAYRAVNTAMVQAYWQVGRLIVEHEQGGRKRAAYGEAVLDDLSQRLTADFGRGFDPSNLRYMRLFFERFPNRDAVRHRLPSWEFVTHCVSNPPVRTPPERYARNSPGPTTECSWASRTPKPVSGT